MNSTHLPQDQADADARQYSAEEQMHEHVQGFFDIHNALQFSGPAFLSPDHGVSQLLVQCTHPKHMETNVIFLTTLQLPLVISLQGVERLWYVCCICYNAHEEDNS